jgi:hypothetical protein
VIGACRGNELPMVVFIAQHSESENPKLLARRSMGTTIEAPELTTFLQEAGG